jgi:steroid delta-isomerase
MDHDHPALIAARRSWDCVMAGDKAGWLALMADDICIEDPVGEAPTNPTGTGVRGKEAVAAFFDANIAPNRLEMRPQESFVAGDESGHLIELTTTFPDGGSATVRGIFTYRVDADGLLTNLRGYWAMEDMTFEAAPD